MPPFPRWADLHPELLCHIADRFDDLRSYASARAACTSWRRAIAPPSPALLVLAAANNPEDDGRSYRRPYAASLCTRRSFELAAIASGARCVGVSTDGWLALSVVASRNHAAFVLLHPVTGAEIRLPPLVYDSLWRVSKVSKVVFAPRPATDDFAAAAICDAGTVAYVTAGAARWAVVCPVQGRASEDVLVDLVYAEEGHQVYCLTKSGDVHVLRLPERRRRVPAANVGVPEFSLLQPPPQPAAERTINLHPLRCQHQSSNIRMMRYQQCRTEHQSSNIRMMRYQQCRTEDQDDPTIPTFCAHNKFTRFRSDKKVDPPGWQEPAHHLNEPATVEPLLSHQANLPFNPATAFAPPYDTVSAFTSAKNLVFCDGNLYQVWRNESCAVTLQLPAGGQRRVPEHEILVLRYYPDNKRPQPCWDVVNDLGGHSLFVGRNNAVSMYAKGVPALRGNCVYWIGGRGRDQGMVFDMESGRSTPVGLLSGHHLHSTISWYFLS